MAPDCRHKSRAEAPRADVGPLFWMAEDSLLNSCSAIVVDAFPDAMISILNGCCVERLKSAIEGKVLAEAI